MSNLKSSNTTPITTFAASSSSNYLDCGFPWGPVFGHKPTATFVQPISSRVNDSAAANSVSVSYAQSQLPKAKTGDIDCTFQPWVERALQSTSKSPSRLPCFREAKGQTSGQEGWTTNRHCGFDRGNARDEDPTIRGVRDGSTRPGCGAERESNKASNAERNLGQFLPGKLQQKPSAKSLSSAESECGAPLPAFRMSSNRSSERVTTGCFASSITASVDNRDMCRRKNSIIFPPDFPAMLPSATPPLQSSVSNLKFPTAVTDSRLFPLPLPSSLPTQISLPTPPSTPPQASTPVTVPTSTPVFSHPDLARFLALGHSHTCWCAYALARGNPLTFPTQRPSPSNFTDLVSPASELTGVSAPSPTETVEESVGEFWAWTLLDEPHEGDQDIELDPVEVFRATTKTMKSSGECDWDWEHLLGPEEEDVEIAGEWDNASVETKGVKW